MVPGWPRRHTPPAAVSGAAAAHRRRAASDMRGTQRGTAMKRLAGATAIVWTLLAAQVVFGHWLKPPGVDSVVGAASDREIRMVSVSDYADARANAKAVWNALNVASNVKVRFADAGETPTLKWRDVNDSGAWWAGYWDHDANGPGTIDIISMNSYFLGEPGNAPGEEGWGNLGEEKAIAANELGHALGARSQREQHRPADVEVPGLWPSGRRVESDRDRATRTRRE